MQLQRLLSLMLLAVIALGVQGFHEEPSDAVRAHIKNTITEEDVQVMQAEMAWGAEEMRKYKTLRGGWPVRSALTSQEVSQDKDDARVLFRGANSNKDKSYPEDAHHEYWNYLISMF